MPTEETSTNQQPIVIGLPLAVIEVDDYDGAPVADHNMPCPICRNRKAILLLNTGRFHPCSGCTVDGWLMIQIPAWVQRWVPWLRSELSR